MTYKDFLVQYEEEHEKRRPEILDEIRNTIQNEKKDLAHCAVHVSDRYILELTRRMEAMRQNLRTVMTQCHPGLNFVLIADRLLLSIHSWLQNDLRKLSQELGLPTQGEAALEKERERLRFELSTEVSKDEAARNRERYLSTPIDPVFEEMVEWVLGRVNNDGKWPTQGEFESNFLESGDPLDTVITEGFLKMSAGYMMPDMKGFLISSMGVPFLHAFQATLEELYSLLLTSGDTQKQFVLSDLQRSGKLKSSEAEFSFIYLKNAPVTLFSETGTNEKDRYVFRISRVGIQNCRSVEALLEYSGIITAEGRAKKLHAERVARLTIQPAKDSRRRHPKFGIPVVEEFENDLEVISDSSKETHSAPFALAFLDIDDFKRLNTEIGHDFADQVIIALAALLEKESNRRAYVYHRSGDEMFAIFPNTTASEAVLFLTRVIQKVASSEFPTDKGFRRITISAGVAECPKDAQGAKELRDLATQAAHKAKEQGKCRAVAYSGAE